MALSVLPAASSNSINNSSNNDNAESLELEHAKAEAEAEAEAELEATANANINSLHSSGSSSSSSNGASASSSNHNVFQRKYVIMTPAVDGVEDDHGRSLKRVVLTNSSITCNDGTHAGFYLRKQPNSKKWIVFLEGGWHCFDKRSCSARWMRLRHLMTSSQWPDTRDGKRA